jgi:hypothetical protein
MSMPEIPSLSRPFVADWLRRMKPGTGGSLTIRLSLEAADASAIVVTAMRAPDRAAWALSLRAGIQVTTLHTEDWAYAAAWVVALSQLVPDCLLPPAPQEVLVQ